MKKLFTLLMVAALAVGCCSACRMRVKNAKPLEGTVWHLVKMGGESLTLPADSFNIILNDWYSSLNIILNCLLSL